MRARILFTGIILTGLIIAGQVSPTYAETTASPSAQETYLKDQYEFLKDQAVRFEDRVVDERQALYSNINILLIVFGLIAGGSFLSFLYTLNSAKKKAERVFDGHIKKIQASLDQRVEDGVKEAVGREVGLQKKIVVLAEKDQHDALKQTEIRLLKSRGFTEVSLIVPTTKLPEFDLLIFGYKDDLDSTLSKTVEYLENNPPARPILVYYKGQVNNQDVKKYPYHVFANTPLTLTSWVFTILSSLRPIKE